MFTLPIIKKQKGLPLYMGLYESIKDSIIAHELVPDEKLPSKRKLAELLGISLKTVENAYEQLILEGYIYATEKKGYFVENLKQYRTKSEKPVVCDVSRFAEKSYRVNLRANRNAKEDFPDNVWCRLVRESLLEDREKLFDVVPFNGVYELRNEIAKHLKGTRGMDVSPDQIIIGAGTEYLYSRLKQVFGENCLYGLPDPYTKRLHELYESNHLRMQAIHADEHGLDIDQLRTFDCDVVHVSPANQYPLGYAMLVQPRIELLKWANERTGRYIIEDDYDSEYVVLGKPIPPLYSIDIRDKVIYMNTFSKSVGPAVRVSYMILPESLIEKYLKTMSFYSCTVSSLEQYTLAKFISKGHLDRYIHKIRRKDKMAMTKLLSMLQPLINDGKASIVSGHAGTHILLKLETDLADATVKLKLREMDIMVSMLSEYYIRDSTSHRHVLVINYAGLSEAQMLYLVECLKNDSLYTSSDFSGQ